MPFIEPIRALYSFKAWGRMGRPMLCGYAWCGWSQCGEDIEMAGVYQQRRHRIGNGLREPIIFGAQKNFFQAPTWPVNPRTVKQQAWRSNFADAVLAWQNLTDEQKAYYNAKNDRRGWSGYNYYLSCYLKSL